MTTTDKPLTDFQRRVLECVKKAGPLGASTWEIAQNAFPQKWKNRSGRGALIAHIDRAGCSLDLVRLPPPHRFSDATFFIPDLYKKRG